MARTTTPSVPAASPVAWTGQPEAAEDQRLEERGHDADRDEDEADADEEPRVRGICAAAARI